MRFYNLDSFVAALWIKARAQLYDPELGSREQKIFYAHLLGSSFLNLFTIQGFGLIYEIVASKMNDQENYRTQTEYDDALIIKTFSFQFLNNYFLLFFIGFLKFGQFPFDKDLSNECMMVGMYQLLLNSWL